MRLADFIEANLEPILAEWDAFAHSIWPGGATVSPAIALSAFVQADDARLALSAGFQVHVSKPVDPYELTSVIARLAGPTG